jgi:N-acylglucosamine-6-phosphate 2-epimerase
VIALDATFRARPNDEKLENIVSKFRSEFKKPLTADIATFHEGINAAEELGFDAIITTLSGYTKETKHIIKPDFELVENLSKRLSIPVICEGRLRSVDDVKRAFECGAFAVVIGNAITGIDSLVEQFAKATPLGFARVNENSQKQV